MTSRERFLAVMKFEPSVAPPLWEFGYWAASVRRWYTEGLGEIDGLADDIPGGQGVGGSMPRKDLVCEDVDKGLMLDHPMYRVPVEAWIFPKFDEEVIEQRADGTSVVIDTMGIKKRIKRDDDSIPEYIAWPVNNRDDWERLKDERLNPKNKERYPANLNALVKEYSDRTYALTLGGQPVGFFGSLRYLLGEVNLFMSFYDQPDLIRDIIDYLVEFWIEVFSPVLELVTVDCFHMWEDMCYKTGTLISPAFFREFMLPAYKRFTSFLRDYGVENIMCDTDGNCWELIPLFLEGGVTGLYPMEVAADMDVVEVRRVFPNLQITGGIDKRVIAVGKEAIERELNDKVPRMLKRGGYIPFADHNIPPDVSWAHILYYRQRLANLVYENTHRR